MRVKISTILNNQLPNFVKEEYPLAQEFLSQYYTAIEAPNAPLDLLQNIDEFVKVDTLTNLIEETSLTLSLNFFDESIQVSSTLGFPDFYGLIQIDDEIITYSSKTDTSFEGCVRGFSGITEYGNELVFSESNAEVHSIGTKVKNLSILLYQQFIKKLRTKIAPGFEGRELFSNLNEATFLKQSKDFYSSKGTKQSFEILFRALYGQDVEVILPKDYVISASNADYRISRDLVVESVQGNPENLINLTLFQDGVNISGTVNNVEKIVREDRVYYNISLDYNESSDGSIPGNFRVNPITKVLDDASINSDYIDVESTIGFPTSGILIITLPNTSTLNVSYESKTTNQFLNCSGITQEIPKNTEVIVEDYAYGFYKEEQILVRVTSVLSEFALPDDTRLFTKKDPIVLKSFGKLNKSLQANKWLFNIVNTFDVEEVTLKDLSDFSYRVLTKQEHNFNIGDSISLLKSTGEEIKSGVIGVDGRNSFIVQGQGQINTTFVYLAKRNIKKAESTTYSEISKFNSNVQAVYSDSEDNVYVTSSSLPAYFNTPITSSENRIVFSGSYDGEELFIGPHKFVTGDLISYTGEVIQNRDYFVKVISSTSVKLAWSLSDVYNQNWIYVTGDITNGSITKAPFKNKTLSHQRLLKKLQTPIDASEIVETTPGYTGIFLNGVELSNYKAKDQLFYGSIEDVVVTSGGVDYDVINPPSVEIYDESGTGAEFTANVIGSFSRIDVLDQGFDYLQEPVITVSGGNGSGVELKPNLVQFDHEVEFDSTKISLASNTIGFSTYHKFRDLEEVIYITQDQSAISGLTTSASYYVSVQDEVTIKLLSSETSTPVDFTAIGQGIHKLKSKTKKNKLNSVTIVKAGQNYSNKTIVVSSSGISTTDNQVIFKNHRFNHGDVIRYSYDTSPVGALTTTQNYYVSVLDGNSFKLSGTQSDFLNKIHIDLTSVGTGNHTFSYPEITVSVSGRVGISSVYVDDFNAILQPVVSGSISSLNIVNGGTNYGDSEILNYQHQPDVVFNSGSGAILKPIINNGRIDDVLVISSGSGYVSIPTLKINGSGIGAKLTPVISNGLLINVIVINPGGGYENGTNIDVIPAGSGVKVECKLQSWRINLVEKQFNQSNIQNDDGYITTGQASAFGLEFSHLYAARKLRQQVTAIKYQNSQEIFVPDLILAQNIEQNSTSHSPILGWAYDGNPIYGPYAYENPKGGVLKQLTSGYTLQVLSTRPSIGRYPLGYFVEDYVYTNAGDLDEFNGRYCITPDYPNGVYAYFCTFDRNRSEDFGNYKKPVFPYVIGNHYKSQPIEFNFVRKNNQNEFDFVSSELIKNVTPFDKKVLEIKKVSEIGSIKSGGISDISIVSGGENYKVGDKVVFDNTNTTGRNASAFVSTVDGVDVDEVSVSTTSYNNIEFYPYNGYYVGFSTEILNLSSNDKVKITVDYNKTFDVNIKINQNLLYLTSGISSTSVTGIVTYFNVSGNLVYPAIRENDIYSVGEEKVKVLEIDKKSSRIKVLRNQEGTVGTSTYFSGNILEEVPKKFSVSSAISTTFNEKVNSQKYFNPVEALGVGVGRTHTLFFSNPGIGETSLTIPTRSVYLPNHNLETGELLEYSNNGGTSILVSTNGSSTFTLSNGANVYAAKISNDLIGISTFKVGVGSTGGFVGLGSTAVDLLYFNGVGVGSYHSFKTKRSGILYGRVDRTKVRLSTGSTHALGLNDTVFVNVVSSGSTTVKILFDEYHQKLVANGRQVSSVDVERNLITVQNHNYKTGTKVIYKTTSTIGGLQNQKIYYVVVVDKDSIKLAETSLVSTSLINLTGSGTGTLYEINPPLSAYRNQSLIFDLSDSSLSYSQNGVQYPAFKLGFYGESSFSQPAKINPKYIDAFGVVGVSTNARVTLNINSDFPTSFYYYIDPINTESNPKTITTDEEQVNHSNIKLIDSKISGTQKVVGISSDTFDYLIQDYPESSEYLATEVSYYTNSKSASGAIKEIKVTNPGTSYVKLPKITRIQSSDGVNSIVEVNTSTIAKATSINILDIGYEYYSDYTTRPIAKLPEVITVDVLNSLDYIGISSVGKNYSTAPNLVLIDQFTKLPIPEADLYYNVGDKQVTIRKNVKNIYDITPKLIPTNNPNGVKISGISYNSTTKDVVVTLGSSFSDPEDFPFNIGDKILIENVSVGINTTGKGYNSKSYDYQLFTVKNTDPNIGGIGATVSYSLDGFLTGSELPGTFNAENSAGRIIPEKYFPIFNVVLEPNQFYVGELVSFDGGTGKVIAWDSNHGELKITTSSDAQIESIISGKTSGSFAVIKDVYSVESDFKIGPSSVITKGWQTETGFLNNNFQRIHDNDYYQDFSYDLRSKVSYDKWENAVQKLNHTAGFKKFSNLLIESENSSVGMSTEQNQGSFESIANFDSISSVSCLYDFDLATENNIFIDGSILSNQVIFNSAILQDYIESFGNRVLLIDDISPQFNSTRRADAFESIDSFVVGGNNFRKYVIFAKDKLHPNEIQLYVVNLIQDGTTGYLNQYARLESISDLGFFDFSFSSGTGNLLFYPTKSAFNDYNVSTLVFNTNTTITGIGTTTLGGVVKLDSNQTNVSVGQSNPVVIVGISSAYTSAKILVSISSTDKTYFEANELSYTHNKNEIYSVEYGFLNNASTSEEYSSGIGTFGFEYSASNVNVYLTPNVPLTTDYKVDVAVVSIANTTQSGIGTITIDNASLVSSFTAISSSPSPVPTEIATYESPYESSYSIVSIEDKTNNRVQLSELVTITQSSSSDIVEYGIVQSHTSLGQISIGVTTGDRTAIYFTPTQNIDTEIRVFQANLGVIVNEPTEVIDLGALVISSTFGDYVGYENSLNKVFELEHKQRPIFIKTFDASDSNVVDVTDNTITIPEHYFVSGEKINYTTSGSRVGIATTTFSGIGTTSILPSELYVIKVDDLNIQLASSAQNALAIPPVPINITSVGVGSAHNLISQNQNARVLISIDNVIQAPVALTPITMTLSNYLDAFDSTIYVSGISSISSGEFIKVDNEIMKITSVGVASTNSVVVYRGVYGSGLSTHANNSLVTKITGNFNIVDNSIYFEQAPYGISTSAEYTRLEVSSTFSGRAFIRSGVSGATTDTYSTNYIFDDISNEFVNMSTYYDLKSKYTSVTGVATDNAITLINGIFQTPGTNQNYYLEQNAGITTITFTGDSYVNTYDINNSDIPRGGIIVSMSPTSGYGFQPLVSAGGTAVVSISGTIQSVSIGNSGSGYRVGVQTVVNVGVTTDALTYQNVGVASVSNGRVVSVAITSPGTGYTSTNPPKVVFDPPLYYTDIPLIYSSSSSGIGTGAKVDIVVGQGSSVINFNLKNSGISYKKGDVLTVSIGGTVGIQTNTSLTYQEFTLTVDQIYNDSFGSWSIGNLLVLDNIDDLFDDITRTFPILVSGTQTTLRARKRSNIDIQSALIVVLNDVLQVPGEAYTFKGGSVITFSEAPKAGDTLTMMFYRGTGEIDTRDVDVLELIKDGDAVQLNSDFIRYQENSRLIEDVVSTDLVETVIYSESGISSDTSFIRPVTVCQQTEDLFIGSKVITKDRAIYEPSIQPVTNLIQSIGISTTEIFVESVKTFFDNASEYLQDGDANKPQQKIIIISQESLVSAAATAVVSIAGTVSSIVISDGGQGYDFVPEVCISNPVGLGTTCRASATASISNGSVVGISIVSPGIAYTNTNPPQVLIEAPKLKSEVVTNVSYSGDFGVISGVSTSGVATTALVLDFFIPLNSPLRDLNENTVGSANTGISGIQTGYYFVLKNTNIGLGLTSLNLNGTPIGFGSTFIDNVYAASNVSVALTSVPGVGTTLVAKVTTRVSDYNGITGLGYSGYFGEFTWGRLTAFTREDPQIFTAYVGIETSPLIQRINPLNSKEYV